MRIALFGHSGYIGKLLHQSLSNRYEVIGFSRSTTGVRKEKSLDITKPEAFQNIEKSFDVVIICTALLPIAEYSDSYFNKLVNVNITGIYNIMNWVKNTNIRKVVYCSTLSVVDESAFLAGPVTENTTVYNTSSHYPYTMSKLAGEQIVAATCNKLRVEYNIMRLSSVYGRKMPGEGVISKFYQKSLHNEQLVVSNAAFNADFIHVDNVIEAIEKATKTLNYNGIINIASGKSTTLLELAKVVKKVTNSQSEITVESNITVPEKHYNNNLMMTVLGVDSIKSLEEGLKTLVL